MENDKLRQHILNLTNQNQNLINEIDCVIKIDQKMKNILNREPRMCSILTTNENAVQSTFGTVKTEIECRSASPHSHHSVHCSPHCSPHYSPNRLTYNIEQ